MPGDSPSWPDYRPHSCRRACHSRLCVLANEVHQRCEQCTSNGLGKQIGNHDFAREMLQTNHVTRDQVTEELGGTQDVFGLLEGDRIMRHVDRGLGVETEGRGSDGEDEKVQTEIADVHGLTSGKRRADVFRFGGGMRDSSLEAAVPHDGHAQYEY